MEVFEDDSGISVGGDIELSSSELEIGPYKKILTAYQNI
jgi:hypothetical protein